MGIGGVGMGALAGLLREAGVEVTGSEGQEIYPPMSTLLQALGVPVWVGYRPENLAAAQPELVIVGNVIRYDNPEVQAVLARKLPYLSFPETMNGYFLKERRSLVVAGTHGKTTTSSLLGYTLERMGQDPLFLVGGLLKDRERNFRYGKGPFAVLEGDEYDTAFFDKRPKFVHYAPFAGILTSVEFDHADIYPDLPALRQAFADFVALIPQDGLLVAAHEREVLALAAQARGRVLSYGVGEGDYRLLEREPVSSPAPGQRLLLEGPEGKAELFLPLIGVHNAENALAVFALLQGLGYGAREIAQAMAHFPGVKRRQEILLEEPMVVIDDFAHHPTAVKVTLQAVRETWPEQRLVAVFEPRTNTSRRNLFQKDYVRALASADLVFLKVPPFLEKLPPEERLDPERLVADLKAQGTPAYLITNLDDGLASLLNLLKEGDVVLFMSNGPLDGLPQALVAHLKQAQEA